MGKPGVTKGGLIVLLDPMHTKTDPEHTCTITSATRQLWGLHDKAQLKFGW
jgi:hypothetical protein